MPIRIANQGIEGDGFRPPGLPAYNLLRAKKGDVVAQTTVLEVDRLSGALKGFNGMDKPHWRLKSIAVEELDQNAWHSTNRIVGQEGCWHRNAHVPRNFVSDHL